MTKPLIDQVVDRFLACPLPDGAKADPCACNPNHPHRTGTNLLTAAEAKQMLVHALGTGWQAQANLQPDELIAERDRYRQSLEEAIRAHQATLIRVAELQREFRGFLHVGYPDEWECPHGYQIHIPCSEPDCACNGTRRAFGFIK